MRKVFYLGTCSTCTKIMNQLNFSKDFELREIKTAPMTAEEVDKMAELAGSYEAIFSRRAMKYKSLGLKDKNLQEQDYRNYILEEYTFLKRPVVMIDNEIFVGNSAKTIAQIAEKLANV